MPVWGIENTIDYIDDLSNSNISNNLDIIEEQDVLRWGYANWGVEKVTSEYKPQEIK